MSVDRSPIPETTGVGDFNAILDERQRRCMERLRDQVMERIARSDPTKSVTDCELRRVAEQRVLQMIPDLHTPIHPTYAYMIRRAIKELNGEGGASKESISTFIRREYEDLPVAHESLLRIHLGKLYEKGEIFLTNCRRYMLHGQDPVWELHVLKQKGKPQLVQGSGHESQGKESEFMEKENKKKDRKTGLPIHQHRWSIWLQSKMVQDGERGEPVKVKNKSRVESENDETGSGVDSAMPTLQLQDQSFAVLTEPLEPPGFPSEKDKITEQNSQAPVKIRNSGKRVAKTGEVCGNKVGAFGNFDIVKSQSRRKVRRKVYVKRKCRALSLRRLVVSPPQTASYVPPLVPPIEALSGLITECTKPFEKQLTVTDLKDDQSRLSFGKDYAEMFLLPYAKGLDLKSGVKTTVYDMEGKSYPMIFKSWCDKYYVLTCGWKEFYKSRGFKPLDDFVTVWMFRHGETKQICFALSFRRYEVGYLVKRKIY